MGDLTRNQVGALGPVALFEVALERIGWSPRALEVDAVRGRVRLELVRLSDARRVTLDAREGRRASITREASVTRRVVIGRRGDRMPVDRLSYELLGRSYHEGWRSAMRALAHYVADNGGASRIEARNVFRLIMGSGEVLQRKVGGGEDG